MRLFFAIPIPEEHKTKLLIAFPERNHPGVRFTIPEQLHITVHFIGEAVKEKLTTIIDAANKIAPAYKAFEIKFHSFKLIQRQNKPIMIWAQMEKSDCFENFCMQFRRELSMGDNKEPNPHITIARIKQLRQLPFPLPHLKPFSFKAECIELLQSVTDPGGAVYSLVDKWVLQ